MAVEFFSKIGKAIDAAFEPAPHILPELPEPRARLLPPPTRSFDKRWACAENDSLGGGIKFIEKEVYRLIQAASSIPEAKISIEEDYAYWSRSLFGGVGRWGYASALLHIDQNEIIQSSLPQPIINYLVDIPYPEMDNWKQPGLWLKTWYGDTESAPQAQITLGTYLKDSVGYLPYWIEASGYLRSKIPNYWDRAWILQSGIAPHYVPDNPYEVDHSELRAKPQFSRYKDLSIHLDQVGVFTTVRELTRFAGNVIAARTQKPVV
ncbi:hypothetical protein A3B39_00250 [Candidatus Daviesbacteria bacterium RIFCSPLOWO2_01_FULL_37_10]|nr:MAG: hypothetical protein A3B39_00250 [Candidatus Daviesbacteria bacterium RIFCSPLOWO2_01_FULL_37_10]